MEYIQDDAINHQKNEFESIFKVPHKDQMTSSLISTTSSLTSPVDSGVQLLDSESEIASVMSTSGMGCDGISNIDCENASDPETNCKKSVTGKLKRKEEIMTSSDIVNQNVEEFLGKFYGNVYLAKIVINLFFNVLIFVVN